ncbi:MAG: RNA polymerase sigma-70 factor [Saprospirales bacterium]|nr:RNA polymerase sigma-70 factor [Saprospirales bacterium]MBK8491507.1 RNA polymerase sigma-70 factor [Saprospirales bacterium]
MVSNPTDIQHRLQSDDSSALQELFKVHYAAICRTIYRLVQDSHLAQDLAQNVFIRVWEKRTEIEVHTSWGAYLNQMAVREGLAHLRKVHRIDVREEIPEQADSDTAEDHALHGDLKMHYQQALQVLPPQCRAVFQLSRQEGLTYPDIAKEMGISVKTVENQMGKALRILRVELKEFIST